MTRALNIRTSRITVPDVFFFPRSHVPRRCRSRHHVCRVRGQRNENSPYCTTCQINECKVGNYVGGVTRCECHETQQCLSGPSPGVGLCTELQEERPSHSVEAGVPSVNGSVSMGSVSELETGKSGGGVLKPGGNCCESIPFEIFCDDALWKD